MRKTLGSTEPKLVQRAVDHAIHVCKTDKPTKQNGCFFGAAFVQRFSYKVGEHFLKVGDLRVVERLSIKQCKAQPTSGVNTQKWIEGCFRGVNATVRFLKSATQ